MTSRKKSGKGKGKRNGRTKRGGFLGELFKKSYSWFGESETAKTDQTAETKTGSSGGWFSNLFNKFQPPTTPENQIPVIPGRPVPPAPLSPATLSPASASSLPSAASLSPAATLPSAASLSQPQQGPLPSAATLSQPPPMQPPPPMQSATGKGGKRRRSSIKKRK
jgi:hypothetical protein